MRILSVLFAIFIFSASIHAQSLVFVIDRSLYPALGTDPPIPTELDSNPATREWVQAHYTSDGSAYEIRGVATRPSGLCIGPWIRPFEIAAANSVPWDVLLLGFMPSPTAQPARFVVIGVRGYYEISVGYGC